MLNIALLKILFMFLYNIITNINDTTKINNFPKKQISITTDIDYSKGFLESINNNYSDLLATISIEKINLTNKPIYNINSSKNNIEENITILKESIMPDKDKSILFLIAHSGFGPTAYFKHLDILKENDLITINYNNKKYLYKAVNIYEVPKNGYLEFKKNFQKELILSTCSKDDKKQLIIDCIQIN